MGEIKQHSVWMVELGYDGKGHEQQGNRPFYVISSTKYNSSSNTPIGFFMSTSKKKASNRFAVNFDVGVVNVSQIRTLSSERFLRHMGDADKAVGNKIMQKFVSEIL